RVYATFVLFFVSWGSVNSNPKLLPQRHFRMCSFQRDKSDGREWNRDLFLQPRQLAACLSDPSLRRWGRTFGESRSAPPWLLRLEKDKYSGSARGMRLPHESNRRRVRANCFLPAETRRGNCSWGPRAQFRWGCAVHDAGGDE